MFATSAPSAPLGRPNAMRQVHQAVCKGVNFLDYVMGVRGGTARLAVPQLCVKPLIELISLSIESGNRTEASFSSNPMASVVRRGLRFGHTTVGRFSESD